MQNSPSLGALLGDYVIAKDGNQVKVADIEGKSVVALYFSAHWCPPCRRFTPTLVALYNELKEKEQDFEIIFVSSDRDEASFDDYFQTMPWLAVPFSDSKTKQQLDDKFEVEGIPSLIIVDSQGQTLQIDGVELVYKYGAKAYPFTQERLAALKDEEKALRESQTLEKLLVSDAHDFVLSHGDVEVKVSSLVGKTVGLYFSAHWCPPCRRFTPELASVYNQLKTQGAPFEIVFVSCDQEKEAFEEYYKSMPWLALSYGDERNDYLSQYFEVEGIPYLVIIGPDGKTVTDGGKRLVSLYGDKSFPFTDGHIAELQKQRNAEKEKYPNEITTAKHEHALTLAEDVYDGTYICDDCDEQGSGLVYQCEECGYDLHPGCAKENAGKIESMEEKSEQAQSGYVCDGESCQKV